MPLKNPFQKHIYFEKPHRFIFIAPQTDKPIQKGNDGMQTSLVCKQNRQQCLQNYSATLV